MASILQYYLPLFRGGDAPLGSIQVTYIRINPRCLLLDCAVYDYATTYPEQEMDAPNLKLKLLQEHANY